MSSSKLVEIAYEKIRQGLLNAEYPPGMLLSESDLAAQMNMSRTPIRDAIRLLEKEGFVKTLTKRGVQVNAIEIKDLLDMFDVLTALYLFTLDIVEQYNDEINLPVMKQYLDQIIEASEQRRYRAYYENCMMFMRTLLETIHNQHMLQIFDFHRDKILFYVVAHRSHTNPNRPYTGKKTYSEIYERLEAGDIQGAKAPIINSKWQLKDELLRNGR
ncbi:DNA-binding transcriptional regulator CsiR [compost metagenome]